MIELKISSDASDAEKACKENFLKISTEVLDFAKSASPQSAANFKIVAVSKLQPIEKIFWIHECGQRDFGENYIQEHQIKYESELLRGLPIDWHFVGHLQSNKAKASLGKFYQIDSISSFSLAARLSEINHSAQRKQRVLVEVNLAGEESKSGFLLDELEKSWLKLQDLAGLEIAGFMTMPPLGKDAEASRTYFRQLKSLANELDCRKILSMGTSHDFKVAIEEGATEVRLGTALFGARQKK